MVYFYLVRTKAISRTVTELHALATFVTVVNIMYLIKSAETDDVACTQTEYVQGLLLLAHFVLLLRVSFLRFAPSVVSSPPPAALLLAAPSLAVLLVLVLRGMKPALPLSRPAWPPYLL